MIALVLVSSPAHSMANQSGDCPDAIWGQCGFRLEGNQIKLHLSTILFAGTLALLASGPCAAHPGGLTSKGCHNNRSTGEYHCHRGPAPSRPAPTYQAPVSRAYGSDAGQSAAGQSGGCAFRNCDEARAAGAAPVRRGDPGYGPHLDRDNDGVGCEPYRGR